MSKTVKQLDANEKKLVDEIFRTAQLRVDASELQTQLSNLEHNEKVRAEVWQVIHQLFPDLPADADLQYNNKTGTIEER